MKISADERRIERELKAVIKLLRNRYPKAVDYSFEADERVLVYDKNDNVIATLTEQQLNDYWNAI